MIEKRKTNEHSSPEDFLLPEFEEVDLPSGLHAKLRPPSLDMWIEFSDLPATLLSDAFAESAGDPVKNMDAKAMLSWEHHTICYLFIEPRFSTGGEEGAFHPSRLRSSDRQFVSQWVEKFNVGGGGAGLKKFRGKKRKSAGAGPGGKKIRQGAE